MKLSAEQRKFLATVKTYNRFNAVRCGKKKLRLPHPFWTLKSILAAIGDLQADWDVPKTLVPFYGDWHTVICLELKSGAVKMLDDRRKVVCRWASTENFVRGLSVEPEEPIDTTGIIESESYLDF